MAACDSSTNTHRDALALVEFLMDHHGSVTDTQDAIARKLGMVVDNGGMLSLDRGRFHRARQHVHDRCDISGRPCCGFRLNYRKSGRGGSTLTLVDPSGDLGGSGAKVAMSTIGGFTSRKRQHDTEDRRMLETFQAAADNCLAQGDMEGARVMLMARIDIERQGAVTPQTMAELETYMATS